MTRCSTWRRWVVGAVALVALVGGCTSGGGDEGAGEGSAEIEPVLQARATDENGAPNPEFVGSDRRGPWALRLWVGLWCDHRGHASGGTDFTFYVDGVRLYRLGGTCERPTAAPESRPNAGAFAFTLGQGAHLLEVVAPDGTRFPHRFELSEDSWLTTVFTRDEQTGEPQVAFEVYRDPLPIDRSYEPATEPEAEVIARYAAGEEVDGYRRPSADLVAGAGGAGEVGQGGDGEEQARAGRSRRARGDEPPPEGWRDASMGVLAIRSQVPARVWIDGEDTGEDTPVAAMPMRMGRYRVELRDAETGTSLRTFSVEIEPGTTRTLVN